MSANISSTGIIRQLDRRPEPETPLQEGEVQDPPTLVRIITGILRDLTGLRARWWPNRIDFEGIVSTGTNVAPQTVRLNHGLGANVRWWVVDCTSAGVVAVPLVYRTNTTDLNTLTLAIYFAATLTIRVEEAG